MGTKKKAKHHEAGFERIIGVDNGLSGGLCVISPRTGEVLKYTHIPLVSHKDPSNGKVVREIDIRAVALWVEAQIVGCSPQQVLWAVEEPLRHASSSAAVRSMALSFGQLLALGLLEGWCVERVPITGLDGWQRQLLGRVPKSKTKEYALRKADELTDGAHTWIPTPRHRVVHDGIVDAFLVAYFTRSKYIG